MILKAVWAVTEREIIRMSRQKVRLFASMVRPLIWLFVIGSGVGSIAPEINPAFNFTDNLGAIVLATVS